MTSAKRLFAMAVAGALVVGSMAGCGGSGSDAAALTGSAAASDSGAAASGSGDYTITVITKALDSDYWHVVQAGAILAANDLGVTVNTLGPNNELDTQGEMNQILDAVSNGTDGLVIAPNDPSSLAYSIIML